MQIHTTRFGTIDIADDKVLIVEGGLIGFPDLERFVLLEHRPGSPLHWLQSIDDPGMAFVVANPLSFFPDYTVDVNESDLEQLAIQDVDSVALLAILTIRSGGRDVTANLVGPLLINADNLRGRQLVLDRPDLSTRHIVISQRIEQSLAAAPIAPVEPELDVDMPFLPEGSTHQYERAR